MKRVIPLLVLTLVLTGCKIRFDSVTTVEADGSGTLALEISLDEEFRQLIEESGEGSFFDLEQDLQDIPGGWTASEFSRGEFEGVRISAAFSDFADLDRRLAQLTEADGEEVAPSFLQVSGLSRDGDRFTFRTELEGLEEGLTDLGATEGGGDLGFEGFDPASLFGEVFEIRYLVTLPGEITSHNANVVEGNTLIWNIGITDEGRVLSAESDAGSGSAWGGWLAIAAIVVALGLLGFVALQWSRRRGAPVPLPSADPTAPVTPPVGDGGADPFARVPEDAGPAA
jgi:hypothetical protein